MQDTNTPYKLAEHKFPLVLDHIGYAKKLARQFYQERSNFGFEVDDYEGAALLGLCDAARRYDPQKGLHFRTYCYFRIRGAMFDLLRGGGGIPKRHFNRLIENQKGRDAENSLDKTTTRREALSVENLPFAFAKSAQELAGLIATIEEINIALHINSDDDVPEISYADALNPEELVVLRSTKRYIAKLIRALPEQQQRLIRLRYFSGHSLDEIREAFGGYSKSWVWRIHNQALDNLRTMILKHIEENKAREAQLGV